MIKPDPNANDDDGDDGGWFGDGWGGGVIDVNNKIQNAYTILYVVNCSIDGIHNVNAW